MKHFKDLNACVVLMKKTEARDDVQPEQQKAVAEVVNVIKALKRRKRVGKPEAYEAIREVTELLVKAFIR